jgi:MYXO-CTERM domain-containing protein
MRSRRLAAAVLVCLALPASARAQEVPGAEVVVRLQDPRIYESSGLALSRRHQVVLWTHNDSGDEPRLYAVGSKGRTLATLTLAGVEARDWEALAAGRDDQGRPALVVGDIGDNSGVWPDVSVYRVPEPARLRDATVPATRYRLRYPDGPRDAEALLVDPGSNRLYVATKDVAGGGLYRAPARLRTDQVNTLRRVARVPPVVTDGTFTPDGRAFVLRDYQAAYVYRAPGRRVGSFELPLQFQGESLTVTADGRSVLAGSEGPESEVWRVPIPESALARVTPTTRPPPTAPAPPSAVSQGGRATPYVVAGTALLLVVAAVALRRRS